MDGLSEVCCLFNVAVIALSMTLPRSFRATDEKGMPRKSMSTRTLPRLYGQVNRTLEEMGSVRSTHDLRCSYFLTNVFQLKTLSELEEAFQALPQDESKRKHHMSWKDKHKEGGKESGSKFHLFKKGTQILHCISRDELT